MNTSCTAFLGCVESTVLIYILQRNLFMGAIKYSTVLSLCLIDVSKFSSSCAEVLEALVAVSQKTDVSDVY